MPLPLRLIVYNPHLHFHFIGIGGSGMSGLAEILLGLGFAVSGSDQKDSEVILRLREKGASITLGHDPKNIPQQASLIVRSTAITNDNLEVQEGLKRRIPVIARAELLAELMRLHYGVGVAGSHGKTTTTSLTSMVMEAGGLDPTVIVGGKLQSIGSGGKVGGGVFLVAETDESDRSFLLLKPTVAVVTNIDREHMNAYHSFEDLIESFHQFVISIPFYGLAVLCVDDAEVRKLATRLKEERPIRIITYGFSEEADLRAVNVKIADGRTSFDVTFKNEQVGSFVIPVPGKHIAQNALASLAVGREFGVSSAAVEEAFSGFEGVGRRLEIIGSEAGVTVMNDYAHHPTEIRTTLSAISEGWKEKFTRIIVLFQPHRYSRMQDCMDRMNGTFDLCSKLYVTDVYTAGEKPIDGITPESILSAISHSDSYASGDIESTMSEVMKDVKPGDLVVCMGAGSVGTLPKKLLGALRISNGEEQKSTGSQTYL